MACRLKSLMLDFMETQKSMSSTSFFVTINLTLNLEKLNEKSKKSLIRILGFLKILIKKIFLNFRYDLSLVSGGLENGSLSLGKKFKMELGAVYIISVVYIGEDGSDINTPENYLVVSHEITKPSNVHILLLLPQYIIMSMGEIMFSITIMDFSYAEVMIVF